VRLFNEHQTPDYTFSGSSVFGSSTTGQITYVTSNAGATIEVLSATAGARDGLGTDGYPLASFDFSKRSLNITNNPIQVLAEANAPGQRIFNAGYNYEDAIKQTFTFKYDGRVIPSGRLNKDILITKAGVRSDSFTALRYL